MRKIIVIGGGPAGLAAAIFASRAGGKVTIVEKNADPGVKLLASGGGRANISNTLPASQWPERFGKRGRFIMSALEFLSRDKLVSWFSDIGVPVEAPDGVHLFPVANSARALRDALAAEAIRRGATLVAGVRAKRIAVESGGVRGVDIIGNDGRAERIACDAAVLSAGGMAAPATGSNADGMRLAVDTGHRGQALYPGLVGLRADNLDASLAGTIVPAADTWVRVKGRGIVRGNPDRGRELLLTHGGVSGPAVLDISGTVAELLGGGIEPASSPVELLVRWRGDVDASAWERMFSEWRAARGGGRIALLVGEHVPKKLARWLCVQVGVAEGTTASGITGAQRDALIASLSAFPIRVTATEGWNKAMVTRGGVELREIHSATLASKVVDGLFFAGEVMDIDGPCGGYNLHWAFASGALAGTTAAGGER